ncbi:subtilisin-like protease SBT1.7 [Amborella trichopoda]|nr:subtilisin-like protease SBT1.7 [Amborella trichopoda]|eukprot:XP_006857969.2 subtilisin-like protease SBT1.7 [Amborella trichopoda]
MDPRISLWRSTTILCAIFLLHGASASRPHHHHSSSPTKAVKQQLETYIIHVRQPESGISSSLERESWYKSFFPKTLTSSSATESRMVYAYNKVIDGFAARLTTEEVESMKAKDGFLHAYPDKLLRLQTTRTPQFLGLSPNRGVWPDAGFGSGTIVGVLDGGIWPEHPSLDPRGMPPPPAKWKGICVDAGEDFNSSNCNNKLIGAQLFNAGAKAMLGEAAAEQPGLNSPRDMDGHGTHTATTATGGFVPHAEVLGNAEGTAVGMAPQAHLAIYKVCFGETCADSDILAALDQAVEDGVDVLSLSLGGESTRFFEDVVAIGGFTAVQKGIFMSCAAANSGPLHSTLVNEAPWVLTVGASTLDREIIADVKLGNGRIFIGESLFQPKFFKPTLLPLVYPGASGNLSAAQCAEGALDPSQVSGKVVFCERGGGIGRVQKGENVLQAGGVAMILMNDELNAFSLIADTHVLPASQVSFQDGDTMKAYINSTQYPTATILFKGTVFRDTASPAVAGFSSRGPSVESPGILKPDIIGPGVSILAGWPLNLSPSGLLNDTRRVVFNVISGTSMSTPHLSGLAALLKSTHPDWSPAALKSAMMTTANPYDTEGKPITDETQGPADIFATGAGHVNPTKATDPGLIYDLSAGDYIPYLCGLGYTEAQIQAIVRSHFKCSNQTSISEGDLNYPSISAVFSPTGPSSFTFKRTVTNVGAKYSTYEVEVVEPQGVKVEVKPKKLYFKKMNEKQTFEVVLCSYGAGSMPFSQGHIKWYSGSKYEVRSPIAIAFNE